MNDRKSDLQSSCRLCSSGKTIRVRTINVEEAVGLWREFFKIDIRPEFRGVSEFELWRCLRCDVAFFIPETLTGSGDMYAQLANLGGYYVDRKWEYDVAISDLRDRRRILEIGSGSGKFIKLAKEVAGLEIEGLELNEQAVRDAVMSGLTVHQKTIEEAGKESPGAYDAVCTFQVLEHVAKPGEFLQACCEVLRPGGLLVVCVPNQRSYVRHMVNPLDMPPHHMTRWTRKTFTRLPQYFPLKLIRTAFEPLTESQLGLFMDTYSKLIKGRGLGFALIPGVVFRAEKLLRKAWFRRFFRGQNIYVCYSRV